MTLTQQHIDQIRQCKLFASLSDSALAQIAGQGYLISLDAGQTVFSQGDPSDQFYLVQRGLIKLYRLSVDGTEKVMDLVGPNQSFAESTMFSCKYPLHAAAVEASVVFSFDSKNFMALMRDSVELCFSMMSSMSQRLHCSINEIDQLTLRNGTQRLAEYLLEQVHDGEQQSSHIRLTAPKLVIASRLGIQPETFSRILGRLRCSGMVEMHNDTILLKDLNALRGLATNQG